jgi:hypothetical protein
VYKYKNRDRQRGVRRTAHVRKIAVDEEIHLIECLAALVAGFLGRYGDTFRDRQDVASRPLERLGKFLALWAEACGLDFPDIRFGKFSSEYAPKELPLSVCWKNLEDKALPVVELMLKNGYQPLRALVQTTFLPYPIDCQWSLSMPEPLTMSTSRVNPS